MSANGSIYFIIAAGVEHPGPPLMRKSLAIKKRKFGRLLMLQSIEGKLLGDMVLLV